MTDAHTTRLEQHLLRVMIGFLVSVASVLSFAVWEHQSELAAIIPSMQRIEKDVASILARELDDLRERARRLREERGG